MRQIAFVNEKGGTCKTTLAVNVAAWLAQERGARVLLCDLDTQGHAGKSLGVDVRGLRPTVADLLREPGVQVNDVVISTGVKNLSLLPGNKELAELPVQIAHLPDRETRLRQKLSDLAGYDYVIFDSPPSMGLAVQNVLLATEEVVVPVACTYLALDGCAEMVATVEEIRQRHGHHRLRISAVVPTLYRRTSLADAILEKLRERFPLQLTRTVLGLNVHVDEAQSHGKTIFEYAPWSRGAQLLEAIAREIEGRDVAAAPARSSSAR